MLRENWDWQMSLVKSDIVPHSTAESEWCRDEIFKVRKPF